MNKNITLAMGSGGADGAELLKLILKYFNSPLLRGLEDAAVLKMNAKNLVFTTDSYVVSPVFFDGGNIGDLAVCGTVNDISVRGGAPKYISVSFILEEGFALKDFERILKSMAARAREAGVQIVTGDTKVVERGKCDKIFINTSGAGELLPKANISVSNAKAGDVIIASGPLGEHGLAVMNARHNLGLKGFKTDSAPLNQITRALIKKFGRDIKLMRDITRGGLAGVLAEISAASKCGAEVYEDKVPLSQAVKAGGKLLGVDPLALANEGKFLLIINKTKAVAAVKEMKKFKYSAHACVIGEMKGKDNVLLRGNGVRTKILPVRGAVLPRIC